MQRHFGDIVLAEPAIAEQAINQLTPDHAGRAQNQNMQKILLFIFIVIASQRVRAKRSPMTGSAKQSRRKKKRLDRFVALLLAMTPETVEVAIP
jgi:hypothetical protein